MRAVTLSVFAPFVVLYLKEPLKLDSLWAALCMVAAVFFMFRGRLGRSMRRLIGSVLGE